MKQDKIREDEKNLSLDEHKKQQGYKYKILWNNGHISFEKEIPKETEVQQIYVL